MKKASFIGLFFLFTAVSAHAQYLSRLGRFSVDEIKGCAPLTVTILDANLITTGQCTAGFPCLMTSGDGSAAQQNQFIITYTQPGTYTLSVLYQNEIIGMFLLCLQLSGDKEPIIITIVLRDVLLAA